ncbi:LacI family DNA-binding transcriptional regulator [Paenibacillus lignilyticus]|uniref:LacI family DNA-binding transcriptional regulator n=1 Tax=Paenibacillus lignilyticus TaxID=1172615 RepID=A0ABS5CKW3_9BACL|nr:LacI family DNA-binding transcriptional regulator [Paenibacillus lignilyticus]MBP3966509.1 LacI family DNA-binding transcriptional regulator [Paenibacillus lignilyticus]
MKPKVTMQNIADELKLSKNSVSQALTGKDGVSEDTRKLIIETAQRMGYIYSRGKKEMSNLPLSGKFALIASDFAFSMHSFFGQIYLSVEKEVKQQGYELLIQSIGPDSVKELLMPTIVQNRSVDGMIILSHITTDYINALLDTGIPAVLIDHHHPQIKADCILTNNRFGAYEAVSHLIELGHKNIGFVGDIAFSPSYYERLDGYRMAMYEYGLPIREEWVHTSAIEDGSFICSYIKGMREQPTAWFCVNDGLGFFLNAAVQQQGLSVPEDVSIVSFDNGYLSRISTPPSTTVEVDLKLYAVKAVERLIERINCSDDPFTELLLPTRLIVRGSTVGPRVV